jgi:hypothetical protein
MMLAEIHNGRLNELTLALTVEREVLDAAFASSFILTFTDPNTGITTAYNSADLGGLANGNIFDNTETQSVYDPWAEEFVLVKVVKIKAGLLGVTPGTGYVCSFIAVDPLRPAGVVFDKFYANVYPDVLQ